MEPSERLEEILLELGWSFSEFVRRLGLDKLQGQRDKYVGKSIDNRKKSVIKMDKRINFEKVGINYDWYLTGKGSKYIIQENTNQQSIEYTNIPSLISAHQCGFGSNINDGIEMEEVPKEFVENMKEPYLITASGDSMSPIIQHGDRVFVERNTPQPKNGDIVAVFLNGEYLIKVFYFKNYTLYLKSINEEYETITIGEHDTFQLLGIVVSIFRKIDRIRI